MKYLFLDLDGTLSESKQNCEPVMLEELARLSKRYGIIIVSGAELSRIQTQVPIKYATFMSQNGNEVLYKGKILWKNFFRNKEKVLEHFKLCAKYLDLEIKDDMIDDRGSQISFSFVGHNSPLEIKKKFDPERKIRTLLLEKFPIDGVVIGGTTCLDYIPFTKGENIRRFINNFFIKPADCIYIGDAFMKYGNDATVPGVIPTFLVESPTETLNFLKQL